MDTGVESSPETGVVVGGIALDFPESDTVSFSSPRRKLKKRLIEAKTPTTHLRRQAKRQRAEFLGQRGLRHSSVPENAIQFNQVEVEGG
ncbi:hypothetical protein OIU84_023129 [Salix udensis]|uniref:Uncharacterized protein n=1 Tax=Salix udensis TaxID=889485 RepID=A0AAD6PFZ6_9ROSI|nr:hypothetical protein OIU84_023129 [Salix udensis]